MRKDDIGRKGGQHCVNSVIHCLLYYKATNLTIAPLLDCLQYGRLDLLPPKNAATSTSLVNLQWRYKWHWTFYRAELRNLIDVTSDDDYYWLVGPIVSMVAELQPSPIISERLHGL